MKPVNKSLIYSLVLSILIFSSCGSKSTSTENTETSQEEVVEQEVTASLEKVWETSTDLTTNESAHYEESDGMIYVANIEGGPAEKDGVGSISKLNTNGEIIERNWVSGLNAPKGMTVMGKYLYVTDVDRLLEIELATGKINKSYEVDNAVFLNDADTDGERVYFTDMKANKILYLENGEIKTFAENQPNINGLRIGNGNTLYGLDADGFKKYKSDGSFEILNNTVTGGDGLIVLDENTFIASKWGGEIYLIKDGEAVKLLDTTAEESNTADIGYIPADNLVIVPTFFKDKVVAYKLSY
ncbi:ATP-binding protein [Cyclobacterium sp. 1_MG-2023]|uniref:YncE family protein n=1 Tax=Cyclobacterium sp. 1_MG-2023 TaxID=3062681 RepID=UPI0026E148F7|nr:ATP-binding protein [Cyclobacterium sp. 1_MG-2023]MDO6437758.1 ATP-binding protein [Cyclobacterium sp. 1_MG-2023]